MLEQGSFWHLCVVITTLLYIYVLWICMLVMYYLWYVTLCDKRSYYATVSILEVELYMSIQEADIYEAAVIISGWVLVFLSACSCITPLSRHDHQYRAKHWMLIVNSKWKWNEGFKYLWYYAFQLLNFTTTFVL